MEKRREMKRVHILIQGRVQGVFFRANTRDKAVNLGLNGWVRNVGEGVEAVFEGEEETIEEILEFCKKGPEGARVNNIKVKEEKYVGEFDSFEIRH